MPLRTYSSILDRQYHRFIDLEIRRALTVFTAHDHPGVDPSLLVIIEHDSSADEAIGKMVGILSGP